MASPTITHPFDPRFLHTLRCAVCWAKALRRKGVTAPRSRNLLIAISQEAVAR